MRNFFVFLLFATAYLAFNTWVASMLFVYFQHGALHLEPNPITMVHKLYSKDYYGLEFWWENYSRITWDWWDYYMVKLLGSIAGMFGGIGLLIYLGRDRLAERFF